MIVIAQGGHLRLVTQPDHARLAAEVLALWRADGVPEHPRRTDLLVAVREHDNGWREPDAAPRVDASGRPLDFRDAPEPMRRALWLRAVERFADERPYLALLAARHALTLHRDRRGREDWREWFEELDERRPELLERTGLTEEELEEDYRWLLLADTLSLALCGAFAQVRQGRWRASRRDGDLALEPFPLAGATTFRVPCRHLPDRPYAGEADLAGDLAAARWEEVPVHLVPAHPDPEGP